MGSDGQADCFARSFSSKMKWFECVKTDEGYRFVYKRFLAKNGIKENLPMCNICPERDFTVYGFE